MSTPIIYNFAPTQPAPPMAAASPVLLEKLAAVIEQRTMMLFGAERRNHFASTVAARTRATGQPDLDSYIQRVMSLVGESEMLKLIDDLTINETTFFRNVPQLEMVTKVAIPEIINRKRTTGAPKRIDIWSAACSTGQEVYTLAILANEALRFMPGWDVRVFGTDISPTVLDVARRGVYPKARLDTMPLGILPRYFDDLGEEIRVKDTLRRITIFQHHNLRETLPPGVFDIIFCRNVMIYFSREEQAKLVQKFKERLAPEGLLFIGHSESLQGLGVDYRLRIHERGIAYQRPAADK